MTALAIGHPFAAAGTGHESGVGILAGNAALFGGAKGMAPASVRSLMRTAASLGRLSWFMRLIAKLPESSGAQGSRPWSGVCLLGR